jgi:hypothetical protein
MSDIPLPRPWAAAAPCTAAKAGKEVAATDAAPRVRMNDLRDRPDLKSLLMVKLLKINRLVKSRHCYDRRMDQLGAEHFHCKQIDLQNLKFLRVSEGVSEFAIELVLIYR